MARKVKFPLELKDGYLARSNIEEVREHFDLEKVIAQFHNGRLKIWLEDHYLPEMAEQVAGLDADAPNLAAKLCAILGVEGIATENVDSSLIRKREEKRQRLSQYTTNPILCDMAECAAFEQGDLDALIDEGIREIILCNNSFRIPLLAENRTYYGVGKSVAVIESDTPIEFMARGIQFVDVPFDEKYTNILLSKKDVEKPKIKKNKTQSSKDTNARGKQKKKSKKEGISTLDNSLVLDHRTWYEHEANHGNYAAMVYLGIMYEFGMNGVVQSEETALRCYRAAAEHGNGWAMYELYLYYTEIDQYEEAQKWCMKAAHYKYEDAMCDVARQRFREDDYIGALHWIGRLHGITEVLEGEEDVPKILRDGGYIVKPCVMNLLALICSYGVGGGRADMFFWFREAAIAGDHWGMYNLAQCYEEGDSVVRDFDTAIYWYKKSAQHGNEEAKKWLKKHS